MVSARKIAAAFLSAMLFASSLTLSGCGKHNAQNQKISAKDTWYSIKQVKVGERFANDPEVRFMTPKLAGISNGIMVYHLIGNCYEPKGNNGDINVSDYLLEVIEGLNSSGELLYSIDLKEVVNKAGIAVIPDDEIDKYREGMKKAAPDITDYVPVINWYVEDKIDVTDKEITVNVWTSIPSYDLSEYTGKLYKLKFDLMSGELISLTEAKSADDFKDLEESLLDYAEFKADYDGYRVEFGMTFDMQTENSVFAFCVKTPEGDMYSDYLSKLIPDDEVDFVSGMAYLGDGKLIFATPGSDIGSERLYEYDLISRTAKPYSQDISDIRYYMYSCTYADGIGNVASDSNGIMKIDFKENKKTELFSYDCCNINRADANNMELLTMSEDRIILSLTYRKAAKLYSGNTKDALDVYILSKEKTNPNAGKKLLSLAYLDNLSYAAYEAVYEFNETSKDYFIKIDKSYSFVDQPDISDMNYKGDDTLKLKAELAYKLSADIANGSGPDIVLNTAGYSNLNTGEYFIDLKNEIKTDGLFGNIAAASETEGKLYQCPVAFDTIGIIAKKSDVASSQYGFTFEQYKDFVKGPCNGKDPLEFSQVSFLTLCMHGLQNDIKNGKEIDFNNEKFRALAEYTAENVTEPLNPDMLISLEPVDSKAFKPIYNDFMGFPYLVMCYSSFLSELRVLGVPSKDGAGPDVKVQCSVAVSANTAEKKACMSFVDMLLSENIQKTFAYNDGYTPVNKSAFEKYADEAVNDYNAFCKICSEHLNIEDIRNYGYPDKPIDKAVIGEYEEMIGASKTIWASDAALDMIVTEEMPAYFAGQKSLDDVIKIINDRAKTYISERG